MHALAWTLIVLLLSIAASPSSATMTLGRLPLTTVTSEAGRILHGTVVDVRSDADESGAPATWVTFEVRRTLKGADAPRVTIKQFGRSTDGIGRVPGLPSYVKGEEVVVFLRPDSARGFTSPVGFDDGVYRVTTSDGARTVRSAGNETRRDVEAFLDEVARLVAAQQR